MSDNYESSKSKLLSKTTTHTQSYSDQQWINTQYNETPYSSTKHNGLIKWYNRRRGYGFIITDEVGSDLFFHYTGLISDNDISDGDRVQFDIVQTRRGLQAYNVERFVHRSNYQRHPNSDNYRS
ncbi:unnamed protein product [Didymodactylos carnosus]|uniref:CSD domain-containing protein n=1 Tax=Didymodactylos carnosus TaxID=1234261 RepID=A0A814R7A9_9BILA|nr:unnamed protein product [Didymodactylos carnosus]CAF1129190.1 unnamed protein product [Didymodactylos carnosus]CAF3857782.1 unnamed protein product [Didymodactylos carnosus]CAF3892822.1 unnamed protein product [Didymodactylos carnosus]